MKVLRRWNQFIEQHMLFTAPCCLAAGILLSRWLEPFAVLSPLFFVIMAFEGSLGTTFRSVGTVASHPASLITVLIILHGIMPFLAFFTGMFCFGKQPDIMTGILIETAIPAAIVSLTWSGIYKGNAALSLSIVVIDTLISPFVIPLLIHLFLGSSVSIALGSMIRSLLLLIALPAFAAMLCNQMTHNRAREQWKPNLKPFSKLCMIAVITLNSTKLSPYVRMLSGERILEALFMWGMVIAGFLISLAAAVLLRSSREDTVSVLFGGGLRNISAGAVIAVAFFPGQAIFPVMMGTLFQQMTAGILSTLFFSKILKETPEEK